VARRSEPPIARLQRTGRLTVHELQAADEIVCAFRLSVGAPPQRDSDFVVRGAPRAGGADAQEAHRLDVLEQYGRWRADLHATQPLTAAVAMLLDDMPARETERREGWRNGTATRHLVTALRHFAALRGNTPRGVRWKVHRNADSTISC
jgi:hypothetical protein